MAASPLLRVLFLCRGSRQDGLGHVMRTRTVAMAMGRRTSVRLVVVGDPFVASLVANRGLSYAVVPDAQEALETFRAYRPHVVVFDALEFPDELVEEIAADAMTVSLSPIFNALGAVDVIYHRTKCCGDDWSLNPHQQLYAGLEYAVLRENCVRIPEREYADNLQRDLLSVAVCMGGGDSENKTLRLLRALGTLPNKMLIWTLLGEGYAHSYEDLADCIRRDYPHEVILARTTDSMWQVLRHCAVAVLAGGTITYEAAYAGLPSINVFDSARHTFLVEELVDRGVCLSAGFPFEDALSVVNANLVHFDGARHELLAMHRRSADLLDHRGAERIAEQIVDCYRASPRYQDQTALPRVPSHEHLWAA